MNPEIVKFISLSGLTAGTLLSNTPPSGPVAQLVEQLTFNQWVTGSNPVGLTIYPKGLAIKRWAFCFLIRMGFAHNSQFANRLSCYIVGASR